jgi:hypothetical protein
VRDLSLEAAAVEWLRYERQCLLVCLERSPVWGDYRPDIFGVCKRRQTIEIECKRSLADFRADGQKRITAWRKQGMLNVRQFYYIVPPAIADAVRPHLPEYAGLLTLGSPDASFTKLPRVEVERGAPVNGAARRLNLLEMARMAKHQTATLHRLLAYIVKGAE